MQEWELGELFDLFRLLESFQMNTQAQDSLRWGNLNEGCYSVKEGYKKLCASNEVTELWPWKLIWKTKLPTKVMCFTWIALKGAILTQDNLCSRNFQLVNRCYMCLDNSESINHLLLHCRVAADLWHMFLSTIGISWTTPQGIKEAVESWSQWKVERTIKKIWQMIPASIFWCIWAERNRRCFDGISTPNSYLKAKCLRNLYSWSNLSSVNDLIPFLDFISSLSLA
uniref:Reverse transcriptase zinc-binding domain-containing protein n=1 Tax=Nicotiana tabacum TaxID=4097 RepID=A0A1S3Z0C7_TOBAC|nr:PREDICTED: uncharacterized protein LOC107781590 [Nicotiana tabacum]